MNHSQKGFVIPLIIAIVAILALGGVIYATSGKKAEAPVVVDTSDWKTYTNDKHGFEFKYPSNLSKQNIGVDGGDDPYRFGIFQVDDQSPNTPKDGLYGPSISFWVSNLTDASGDTKTAKDEIVIDVVEDGYVYKWTKVDGFEALRAEKNFKSGKQDNTAIDYYIFNGNKLYKLDFNHDNNNPTLDKYLGQFETLVSTFRFIKPVADTTTQPIACTMDAMMCPDGSYVGRSGPKCEFVCPVPTKPYMKVLSPNGGEVVNVGEKLSIKWIAPKEVETVSIIISRYIPECYKNGENICPPPPPVWIAPLEIASKTANDGEHVWFSVGQLPDGRKIEIGKYKISITANNVSVSDVSDSWFEIKSVNNGTTVIGQSVTLYGVKITPLEVVDDSRCPTDVTCVWAGTVKLRVRVEKTLYDSSEIILDLGQSRTVFNGSVTLKTVTPAKKSSTNIATGDYRFSFEVNPSL